MYLPIFLFTNLNTLQRWIQRLQFVMVLPTSINNSSDCWLPPLEPFIYLIENKLIYIT